MKALRPLFFLAIVLMLVGLACNALTGGGDTPEPPPVTEEPVQVIMEVPTEEPTSEPTEEPTEAVELTEEPVEAQDFFTEEFDTNDNWSYFVIDGSDQTIMEDDDPGMSLVTEDSNLVFDLNSKNLWVYVTYDPYEYDDVRIDAHVTNRGVNNNNVSLICRYTEESWYEFNIANNGLYWILVAQVSGDEVSYQQIYNGGSNDIKAGKETNEYTAICDGRELSLYINGKEARTVTDREYALTSGLVGVSASSFDDLPVSVDVDWVQISQP